MIALLIQILPPRLRVCLCKSVSFTVIAFFVAGFLASAQAQYYYLPNLPVYWGPYPPKFSFIAPREIIPREPYFHSRAFRKRTANGISFQSIEDELAGQGYHLIVPIRRKGVHFICIAADAEGQRQRFIYNVFTGKLIDRVVVGTNASDAPAAKSIPTLAKVPPRSEKLRMPTTHASDALPKTDGSFPEANAPHSTELQLNTSNRLAVAPPNPSEPVSSKPEATATPSAQSGQI